MLRALFDKYAEPSLDWVMEGVDGDELVRKPKQIIPVTKLNMITQLTSLLDFHMQEYEENVKDTQVIDTNRLYGSECSSIFSLCLTCA